jgi:hypothetical protein
MNMQAKKNKKKNQRSITPRENVIIYKGPLKLPYGSQERELITTVLHYGPTALVSSGAGLISAVVSDDPAGFVDWSHLSAIYDEYRVLGFTVDYHPLNQYNTATTTVVGPAYTVIDRDDGTALTTESQALEYESLKVIYLGKPWKREVRSMTSIEDASFITTATTVPRNWFKIVGTSMSNTITYGRYFISALVEFRGRN